MAADRPLSPSELAFLAVARTAVLATLGGARGPRLVPICFVAADTAAGVRIYSPLDEKPKTVDDPLELGRVRDILAQPDVWLLVDRWSEDWSRLGWLRIDGRADLLEPGGEEHSQAVAALRAKYPQYAAHRLEDRPVIRIATERARSWGDLSQD